MRKTDEKKLNSILSSGCLSYTSKKEAIDNLRDLIANGCFEVLKPISDKVYRGSNDGNKQKMTQNVGTFVWDSVLEDILTAITCDSVEDFNERMLSTYRSVKESVDLCVNSREDMTSVEDSDIILAITDRSGVLFEKFKKKRRGRRKSRR